MVDDEVAPIASMATCGSRGIAGAAIALALLLPMPTSASARCCPRRQRATMAASIPIRFEHLGVADRHSNLAMRFQRRLVRQGGGRRGDDLR